MSEARLRFLHRSYSRTGRWGWRIARRIRSFGWGLAMLATITAVLGTDVEKSAIYMIFCFTVCAIATGLIWAIGRKAKLTGKRHLPEFGSVGQEMQYTVEVKNEGRRTLKAMLFEEWPPDPRPDFETFANTPEPGEEKRNIVDRKMLFYRWTWLQERERGYNLLEASQSPRTIEAGKTGKLTFHLTPQHRGILKLAELRVLLPDPFGLFQRCRKVDTEEDHIIVLPKRYPLGHFSIPGRAHLHLGGEAASNSVGQTGDFLHLRDYRSGDAMRSVDWKSWARTGIPVVREYEDNFFPHYGVVLDTSGPPGERFEEAISVASSFVASMDTQECLLDLIFIGEKSYRVTAGQGVARRGKLLEVLAGVQPHLTADFTALEALVCRESEHLTGILIIFPDWSDERREFLNQLRSRGLDTTAFVIVNDASQKAFQDHPIPNVHPLHVNQVARDLTLAASKFSS
ncbi:DUF58 domain-containing protein [Roseibacillus persicicus]|uniref:DUF58 domain-containing protein n=1 Tax=Roseibacillus persicicus TaxID=454148 RepID=UPI00398A57AF